MKKDIYIEIVIDLISIILCFFNWKIGLGLFIINSFIFHVLIYGPSYTLKVISGSSIIAAIVYLFFNWKISISLLIISYILNKFRLYGNKINNKYNMENQNSFIKGEWEEFKKNKMSEEKRAPFIKIIDAFMIPDNISVMNFSANYQILNYGSKELYLSSIKLNNDPDFSIYSTSSINYFIAPFKKDKKLSTPLTVGQFINYLLEKGFPNWFIAAYPDVVVWFKGLEEDDQSDLLDFGYKDGDIDIFSSVDKDMKIKDEVLRNIINSFKKEGVIFECLRRS